MTHSIHRITTICLRNKKLTSHFPVQINTNSSDHKYYSMAIKYILFMVMLLLMRVDENINIRIVSLLH